MAKAPRLPKPGSAGMIPRMMQHATPEPLTMFDKIWMRHRVLEREDGQVPLYVDRHFAHDGTGPALEMLRKRGVAPRAVMESMTAVSAKSAPVRARMDPAGAIMIGNAPDFFACSLTNQRQGALELICDAGITLVWTGPNPRTSC
jgi:homoaconitase/3-isopropylmalate dehydratase large subunit